MNRISLLVAILAAFTLTGCIDIIEELFLNADGSGKYTVTIDMSALVSEEMKELLSDGEEEEEEELPTEMDTVVFLSDLNPEAMKTLERPQVFLKSYLHLIISDAQEKMIMTYGLAFEDLDEVNYFRAHLPEFLSEETEMAEGTLPAIKGALFTLKGKSLTRNASEICENDMSEDDLSMVEMLYDGGVYKTIYHFPGNVKKTTIPNAQVDGKTLKLEVPVLDVIKCEAQLSGTIKFKKR